MSVKAFETIRRFDMLPAGSKVVAAFSGGADSTALLHLLCGLRGELSLEVFAAHVNHGIRGDEARRDEEFCVGLCGWLGVEIFVCHADAVAEAAAHGETLEQAARRIRYAFLEDTAARLDARLATAHTLSDSMETMLINLTRGTGLKGLCGIPPVRGRIIRPLIMDERRDTEAYCEQHGLSYVNDSTNFQRCCTRNRLRLDVMPILYQINPSFDKTARRALDNLAADEAFLSELAQRRLEESGTAQAGYDCALLGALPPALRSRAVAAAAADGTGIEPEARHIDAVCALCAAGAGRVQLRGGWFAQAHDGRLFFTAPVQHCSCMPPPEQPLCEGLFDNGGYIIRVSSVGAQEITNYLKNIHKRYLISALDCDRIVGNAVLRGRREGDRLRPAGRGVTKTLKKLMNEAAVPAESRGFVPVAADEAGVVWAEGFGADERCCADETTRRAFVIETIKKEGDLPCWRTYKRFL
ncbi:MAG: tRNA lysidine(34) synthetase TilS [Clostridia bacterium]|nr:tRNA lysidine(34) synthetase TilS [Clostridia bacterium]